MFCFRPSYFKRVHTVQRNVYVAAKVPSKRLLVGGITAVIGFALYNTLQAEASEGPEVYEEDGRITKFLKKVFPTTYKHWVDDERTFIDKEGSYKAPVEIPDSLQKSERRLDRTMNPGQRRVKPTTVRDEEQEKNIAYVEVMTQNGEKSLHPWYPNDRLHLDGFILQSKSTRKIDPEDSTVLLPSRMPLPYGKALTLVIHGHLLWNEKGRRPGMDSFLSRAFEKYEIILYGEEIQPVRSKEDLKVIPSPDGFLEQMEAARFPLQPWNPVVKVDPTLLYTTYFIGKELNHTWPLWWWKWVRALNRPEDSTIIIDIDTKYLFASPNNSVIMKEWDGEDYTDPSLYILLDFLDHVARRNIAGVPVTEIVPQYHDFHKDLIEQWREKAPKKSWPFTGH